MPNYRGSIEYEGPWVDPNQVIRQVYGYLSQTLKIPDPGCAGALGNIQQESGFIPGRYQSGGPARGLVQWQDARFTGLENYASNHNGNWYDLNIALGYLGMELNGGYREVLNFLRSSRNPEACATEWNLHYEVSADRSGTREANARRFYEQIQSGHLNATSVSGVPGGAGATRSSISDSTLISGSAMDRGLEANLPEYRDIAIEVLTAHAKLDKLTPNSYHNVYFQGALIANSNQPLQGAKYDLSDLITDMQLSMAMDQITQLTISLEDPGLEHYKSGLFYIGGQVTWRDYDFVITTADVGTGTSNLGGVTISARPKVVQQIKNIHDNHTYTNFSAAAYLALYCTKRGGGTIDESAYQKTRLFAETSQVKSNIATETPADGQQYAPDEIPSVWTTFESLAEAEGYVLFECYNTIFFCKPTWLYQQMFDKQDELLTTIGIYFGSSKSEMGGNTDYGSNDPNFQTAVANQYDGTHVRDNVLWIECQVVPDVTISYDQQQGPAWTVTAQVPTDQASRFFLGQRCVLRGTGPTNEATALLISGIEFSLAGGTSATITATTPVDPKPTDDTHRNAGLDSGNPLTSAIEGSKLPAGNYGGQYIGSKQASNAFKVFASGRDHHANALEIESALLLAFAATRLFDAANPLVPASEKQPNDGSLASLASTAWSGAAQLMLVPGSSGGGGGGKVFHIGDSISVGMQAAGLAHKYNAAGFSCQKIMATTGITIQGQQANLDNNRSLLANSDLVVIELGTNNYGGSAAASQSAIMSFMSDLKRYTKPSCRFAWGNCYSTRLNMNNINQAINDAAPRAGYRIINWNIEARNRSKYSFDPSLGVHQTTSAGYSHLADFYVQSVGGGGGGGVGAAASNTVINHPHNWFSDKGMGIFWFPQARGSVSTLMDVYKAAGVFYDYADRISGLAKMKRSGLSKLMVTRLAALCMVNESNPNASTSKNVTDLQLWLGQWMSFAQVFYTKAEAAVKQSVSSSTHGWVPGHPIGTHLATDFVNIALKEVGKWYGGTADTPTQVPPTFDCSSLVQWSASQVGVKVPRTAAEQFSWCQTHQTLTHSVDEAFATRGAVLYSEWGESGPGPGHTAISLGNGKQTLEAVMPGTKVGVYDHRGETGAAKWQQGARLPGMKYA